MRPWTRLQRVRHRRFQAGGRQRYHRSPHRTTTLLSMESLTLWVVRDGQRVAVPVPRVVDWVPPSDIPTASDR